MFGLVRFYDQSLGIYPMKNILTKDGDESCLVKHRGTKYEATLITRNEEKETLLIVKDRMENEIETEKNSEGDYDFSNFSIGIEYIDIEGSANSSISHLDKIDSSAGSGDNELYNEDFQDIGTTNISDTTEFIHENVGIDEQDHGLSKEPPEEDDIQEKESSDFDDSDEDPNYESSSSEESESDMIEEDQDPQHRYSPLTEIGPIIDNREPPKTSIIQVQLSASLTEPSCDDENLKVAESRGKKGDKKWNFCLYCHTKQMKIARHLEQKHKDEEEVRQFILLPKGNIERAHLIGRIRKKGNFLFNTDENLNDGELIVTRRPKNAYHKSGKDYRACANCRGFFSKKTLRFHFRSCTGFENSKMASILAKKITGRIHPKASSMVKNHLFPPLREDDVTRSIRYDELIIIYANKMVEKYREIRHFQMIRQRLRLLGNFLRNMRNLSKDITDLASIYDPKFVDHVLSAINSCARYNELSNSYGAPSVAFSLGTLLKQIGQIWITESIKGHNEEIKKNTKNFLKILSQEVNIHVNRTVSETQLRMSRKKNSQLPTMSDIKKLCDFLAYRRKIALENSKREFSNVDWMELAEATLTSIQVFNRRRAGEVERIHIVDFESYETVERSNFDLFQSLPEKSKEVAKKYVRFAIRGKLNRTVPVLLDTHLCECIETIIKNRRNMGVSEKNPYVFGTPGSDTKNHPHLKACALMRKFSEACGAEYPKRLRGTNLRKHMATTCITLNLESQDISDLSNFMGHSEKIHKGIYRQPIISRDILGISKLLEAAQGASNDDSSDEESRDGECSDDNSDNEIPNGRSERSLESSASISRSAPFETPNVKRIKGSVA